MISAKRTVLIPVIHLSHGPPVVGTRKRWKYPSSRDVNSDKPNDHGLTPL